VAVLLTILVLGISGLTWITIAHEQGYFTPIIGEPSDMKIVSVNDTHIGISMSLDVFNPNSVSIPASLKGVVSFFDNKIGDVKLIGDTNISERSKSTLTIFLSINLEQFWTAVPKYFSNEEYGVIDIEATFGLRFTYDLFLQDKTTKEIEVDTASCRVNVSSNLLEMIEKHLSDIDIIAGRILLFSVVSASSEWQASPPNDLGLTTHVEALYCRFIPLFDRGSVKMDNSTIATFTTVHEYSFLHRINVAFDFDTAFYKEEVLNLINGSYSDDKPVDLDVTVGWDGPIGRFLNRSMQLNIERGSLANLFEIGPCTLEDKEPPDVSNHDAVITLLGLLWVAYILFLITIYYTKIRSDNDE
jgi:LEA14-like dessication related protein